MKDEWVGFRLTAKLPLNVTKPNCRRSLKFCLGLFSYATSTFVLLQFETGSIENNILELSNEVLLSKTKLNHIDNKATRVYFFPKKTNAVYRFFLLL